MSKVLLKYPCKVAGILVPAGTELTTVDTTDHWLESMWSGVHENSESCMVAVRFPHLDHPTFIHVSQIVTVW